MLNQQNQAKLELYKSNLIKEYDDKFKEQKEEIGHQPSQSL